MDELNSLFQGFAVALTFQNVLLMLVGILLGVLIGVLFAGAGLVAGSAAVVAIRLARSRPTAARVLGVLLALAGLGVAYPIIVDTDMDWWLAMLPGALLLLALLPDDRPVQ